MSSRLGQANNSNNNGLLNNYNLGGVLHFLQAEWRNFEKQRVEWEIERAELSAKIASLEGERKASESVRNDLLKRIKMLEFALRQERGKLLSNSSNIERGESPSPSVSSIASPVNYAKHILKTRNSSASLGGQKSKYRKDKCREILKMCLEELNTIPSTLPPGGIYNSPFIESRNEIKTSESEESMSNKYNRVNNDRKSNLSIEISNEAPPEFISSPLPPEILKKPTATTTITVIEKNKAIPRSKNNNKNADGEEESEEEKRKKRITVIVPEDYNGVIFDDMGHSPLNNENMADPDLDPVPFEKNEIEKGEEVLDYSIASLSSSAANKLSSILKALGRKQEEEGSNGSETVKENENSFLNQEPSLNIDSDVSLPLSPYSNDKEVKDYSVNYSWKPKLTLKSHLDTIRSIDFHQSELTLASGSEDGTVKIWNLQALANLTKKTARQEIEPTFVYRGHTGPVTCVEIGSEDKTIYSSSFDCSIKAWKFPRDGRTTQDPTEPSLLTNTFIGHTDIVWNLKLGPKSQDKLILGSVSADQTTKLWDGGNKSTNNLLSTIYFNNDKKNKMTPTAIDFWKSDPNKVIISYRNSKIQLVDIETGKIVVDFLSDSTYDNTPFTQINCILSHPTMPLLISGHEDKFIRFFDINSGKSIHSMVAHLDSVSSLDISSSNLTLVSGGHDASIRWWDLSNYSCIQEFSSHRSKSNQAVYSVKFHKSYPWLATAGADSIVKLFSV
ncbi:WD40 repeat-like protein [Neoconidiobolus thromboides FSU 785]|nr:WD40 repeat-like protein [Neoconidiobolus thromboides FSU 785]